jgi:4-carboxymuconolactone decarboxylase
LASVESTVRIAPIEPPYGDEIAAQLERWMGPGNKLDPLKLFRVFMVHEQLAGRMWPLGSDILGPKALVDPREREVMIHRTTALTGAEYEWGVHAAIFGPRLAFTEEQLASTVHGSPNDPCWSERESLVFALADELHHTSDVSDELYAKLAEHWSPEQIVELFATAGWYHTISYIARGARVELEPWAKRFPA